MGSLQIDFFRFPMEFWGAVFMRGTLWIPICDFLGKTWFLRIFFVIFWKILNFWEVKSRKIEKNFFDPLLWLISLETPTLGCLRSSLGVPGPVFNHFGPILSVSLLKTGQKLKNCMLAQVSWLNSDPKTRYFILCKA